MLVDRRDHRGAEEQELHVLARRVAGLEQVVAGVGAHRPVVVLAGAVDAGERLLVQQADEAVAPGDVLHDLHRQLLVIGADVRVLEDRRELVLRRRDLVVARLDRHAEALQLALGLEHAGQNALGDRAEVVLVELVALRRLGAEQRAARRVEVGTLVEVLLVDQEVLLLGADGREDPRGRLVAEHLQRPQRHLGQRVHRAQQRDLLVQRLARPGDERGRDTEDGAVRVLEDEGGGSRIPGRVAAGLERGADAARRERGRVRLALDQLLAGELGDRRAVADRGEERVVLLGGQAGQRLEPVRVMGRALLHRPLAHRLGDRVGERGIERGAGGQGLLELAVDVLRQARLLDRGGEHVLAVDLRAGLGQVGRAEGVAVGAPLCGADVLLSGSTGHRVLRFLLLAFTAPGRARRARG